MPITRLKLNNFRCIQSNDFEIDSKFQLITGGNGSGKTSIIESIFFISLGRSFRSKKMDDAIKTNTDNLLVYTETNEPEFSPIAGAKTKNLPVQFKINSQSISSVTQLANALPVQLLSRDTLNLFTSEPKVRRAFVDRGCYYFFEDTFNQPRMQYSKALQQRNALLRNQSPKETDLNAFEMIMGEKGEALNSMREEWLEMFSSTLNEQLETPEMMTISAVLENKLQIKLQSGWAEGKSLQAALYESRSRDSLLGYTSKGPHTAEINFTRRNNQSIKLCSNGEQKSIGAMFLLVQAMMLSETSAVPATLLIDDLEAELDSSNIKSLISCIVKSGLQVIYAAISPNLSFLPEQSNIITLK